MAHPKKIRASYLLTLPLLGLWFILHLALGCWKIFGTFFGTFIFFLPFSAPPCHIACVNHAVQKAIPTVAGPSHGGDTGSIPVGTTKIGLNLLIIQHNFSGPPRTFHHCTHVKKRLAIGPGQIGHEPIILLQGHHRAFVPQHAGHPIDIFPGRNGERREGVLHLVRRSVADSWRLRTVPRPSGGRAPGFESNFLRILELLRLIDAFA
jgi:hypothetical protein